MRKRKKIECHVSILCERALVPMANSVASVIRVQVRRKLFLVMTRMKVIAAAHQTFPRGLICLRATFIWGLASVHLVNGVSGTILFVLPVTSWKVKLQWVIFHHPFYRSSPLFMDFQTWRYNILPVLLCLLFPPFPLCRKILFMFNLDPIKGMSSSMRTKSILPLEELLQNLCRIFISALEIFWKFLSLSYLSPPITIIIVCLWSICWKGNEFLWWGKFVVSSEIL